MDGEEDSVADVGPIMKKRRQMVPRSAYWAEFDRFEDPDKMPMARCKACKAEVRADPQKNGTTSLRSHSKACKERIKITDPSQTILGSGSGDNIMMTIKCDTEIVRNALVRLIVRAELPFSFVAHPAFIEFMSIVCPIFRVPSRWTMQRDMFMMFANEKEKLRETLTMSKQRILFTTDSWTSDQCVNYMCLTAHYIDENWVLHKRLISFCSIFSHKEKDIGLSIDRYFRDWGLENIFTITVDNASSNDVALHYLKEKYRNKSTSILRCELMHMRCVAHIVNLIVKEGLKLMDVSVVKIREVVKYIKASTKRLGIFKECVVAENIDSKCSLVQDVPTRWNLTYLILASAIKLEKAIGRYDDENDSFRANLTDDNGKCWVPDFSDWENGKRFIVFLKHFYDLTLKVSGSKFITSNTFFHEIVTLDEVLREWQDSSDSDIVRMAIDMKAKYDKYWGDPEKLNKLLFVVVIFDPRVKLNYVELCLTDIYGEKADAMFKQVKATLYALFEDYRRKWLLENGGDASIENDGEGGDKDQWQRANLAKSELKMFERLGRLNKIKKDSIGTSDGKSELDRYINEDREILNTNTKFDILCYWKNNSFRLPILGQMARDILAMPISTVASESAFSTSGRVLDPFRSSLGPTSVEALLCIQDWLKNSSLGDENIQAIIELKSKSDAQDKIEDELAKLSLNSGPSPTLTSTSSNNFDESF